MIVSSNYTEGPLQADGRRYVLETHVDSHGRTYQFEWLGNQNADGVIQARAALLSEELQAKEDAEAFVSGTKPPLTHLEFRRKFTTAELELIDELNATFESNPNLDAVLKRKIRTAIKNYEMSEYVSLTDPDTALGLQLYVALGILAPERVGEILNG